MKRVGSVALRLVGSCAPAVEVVLDVGGERGAIKARRLWCAVRCPNWRQCRSQEQIGEELGEGPENSTPRRSSHTKFCALSLLEPSRGRGPARHHHFQSRCHHQPGRQPAAMAPALSPHFPELSSTGSHHRAGRASAGTLVTVHQDLAGPSARSGTPRVENSENSEVIEHRRPRPAARARRCSDSRIPQPPFRTALPPLTRYHAGPHALP